MELVRDGDVPLHRQIADQIAYRIATGRLAPGAALPSLRAAQAASGVHLHTVRRAYLTLRDRALVQISTRGVTVMRHAMEPAPASLRLAVARFLAQAAGQYGATPARVRREITRLGRQRPAVTVVECSRTLATSIADQLARIWQVVPLPCLLDEAIPRDEPIVTTYFHFREVNAMAAAVDATAVAVRLRLSPSLLRHIATRIRRGPRRSLAICETDPAFSSRIAAELREALGPDVRVAQHAPRDIARFLDVVALDAIKLVSPRHWDRLGDNRKLAPDVLPLQYEVDREDIEALGTRHGWRRVATGGGR